MAKSLRTPTKDNENTDDKKDGDSDEGADGEVPPLTENHFPYAEINAIPDT